MHTKARQKKFQRESGAKVNQRSGEIWKSKHPEEEAPAQTFSYRSPDNHNQPIPKISLLRTDTAQLIPTNTKWPTD